MTTSVNKSPAGSVVSSGELIFERNHDITTGTLFHEFRIVPELQVTAKTCDLNSFVLYVLSASSFRGRMYSKIPCKLHCKLWYKVCTRVREYIPVYTDTVCSIYRLSDRASQ